MDCSAPGSSVNGISQARILEWVAIPFSWGSNVSLLYCRQILYHLSQHRSPCEHTLYTLNAVIQMQQESACNAGDPSSILGLGRFSGEEICYPIQYSWASLVCGLAGKESDCNVRDLGSVPGLGRSPGEGYGYPLQYSGLENSMDCIVYGVAKSQTRLSDFHFHFTFRWNSVRLKITWVCHVLCQQPWVLLPCGTFLYDTECGQDALPHAAVFAGAVAVTWNKHRMWGQDT